MDALILQAVLPEIRDELAGLPVTKVELVGPYGVYLRFGGSRNGLFLSSHPELSRLGLVPEPPSAGEPRPGPDNLARPLKRGTLVGVEQEPGGRVARLRFEADDARHRTPSLVAELIPRFANLILVGNDERILWSRREFTGDRPRQIAPGHRYEPPAADAARGPGGGARGHERVFEEAGLDAAERLAALSRAAGTPRPHVARHDTTGAWHLFPADPGPIPGWTIEGAASPNEAVNRYYAAREQSETDAKVLADLKRVLGRRRARAEKALRRIDDRLDEAGREPELRHQAELLSAHLSLARRGMKSVTVPEFDGTDEVEIALDPKLAPQENVDRLFRRARRLARGGEESRAQRAIQESEIAEADRGLAALDPPPAGERLRALATELAPSVLAARERGGRPPATVPAEPERRPSLPPGFQPRVYDLPGGWEVWVGRDSRQNDELTHRYASPKDLWFHARGCQGSHTVLRISSGKGEPPKEIIVAAAAIAAYHSKARNSGLVPVAYTEKRFVRRARKAPPGTAVMMREKVVMVRPHVPEA